MIRLRPAGANEAAIIRKIILQAKINPTRLDWPRFVLAVDDDGNVVGCGQLKPHSDGSVELASIAVIPEYQGRGIARMIIQHLLAQHPQSPLYLMCRSVLQPFYEKFGFRPATEDEMPPHFKRFYRVFSRLQRVVKNMPGPLIMVR